jgi:hypothetical protein
MVKLELDISQIRNDIAAIHNELHETYNMTENQRRDTVARAVEKLRTLKVAISNLQVTVNVK